MNHWIYLLAIVSASTLFTGCSDEVFMDQEENELHGAHTVTLEAVSRLALAMARGEAATKADGFQQPEIIPIVDIYKDTIFYAVNFFPGWKLISSDKRTPIVLAENEQGDFSLADMDYGAGDWLECMAQDLMAIKESPDWKFPDTDNVLCFEELWNAFAPLETKSNDSYYDIYSAFTEKIIDSEVGHLTSTMWDQYNPYNLLCPYKSDLSGRVPAGCVAVAGAQMLYYLHGRFSIPIAVPTSGYCYGISSNYSREFSNMSISAWDNMDNWHPGKIPNIGYVDTCTREALLIGWVGMNTSTYYGDDKSESTNAKLTRFFNDLGIFCQLRAYDESIVAMSLLDSIPVVIGANQGLGILDLPNPNKGHSFIIDGYRMVKNRTYLTYAKYNPIVDADSSGCVMFVPDPNDTYMIVSETDPWMGQIRMNWGWNGTNNDNWYTMTGSWRVSFSQEDGTQVNKYYDYLREMIYNFQVL